MLHGQLVGVKAVEEEHKSLIKDWRSSPDIMGDYVPIYLMKESDVSPFNMVIFLLTDPSTYIGEITICKRHQPQIMEIGFYILPEFRRKGYCLEAVSIIIDYLFLSRDTVRIQCESHIENIASQNLMNKLGFQKEGTLRNFMFINGNWADCAIYSYLRHEWKDPRFLGSKQT